KEKQRIGGETKVSQKSVEPPIDTQKEVAKTAGVSHDTIYKVKEVLKNAPEEVKQKARIGDISVNKAYNITKHKMQQEENKNKPIPLFPTNKYKVVYADPPWKYGDRRVLEK
ncbi:hypothetical protein ACFL6P_07380, partial [Candidatus Latescibacterota bacterium]